MNIEQTIVNALRERYCAQIKESRAVIKIFLERPAGIGDHGNILGVIDEEIAKAAEASDKLKALDDYIRNEGKGDTK